MNNRNIDKNGIINILDYDNKSVGTGYFISENGHILTCYHVITEITEPFKSEFINFKFAGRSSIYRARICSICIENDSVLLFSEYKPSVYYPLSTMDSFTNNEFKTMGFPNSKKNNIHANPIFEGEIIYENKKYWQLGNANTITFGFSGAPVLDDKGFAIGMICGIPDSQNSRMSFIACAIPSKIIYEEFKNILCNHEKNEMLDDSIGVSLYRQFMKQKTDRISFKGIERLADVKINNKILKLYAPLYIKSFYGISNTEIALAEIAFAERGIVVNGEPGSGKSTFIKYIVRSELENDGDILPFIISLEHFGKYVETFDMFDKQKAASLLINYILQEYPQKTFNFTFENLDAYFSLGKGWFLFDGIDEISSVNAKEKIITIIESAFDYWNECKFVITSRPYALEECDGLTDFLKVYIDVLHKEQMEQYINTLAEIVNINQYTIDANGLINLIRENANIYELARIPVMLTFICIIYFTDNEVPEKRFEIFEKIIFWLIKIKFSNAKEQESIFNKYALIAKYMFTETDSPLKDITAHVLYKKFQADETIENFFHSINEVGIMTKNACINRTTEKYSFWHFCFEEYLTAKYLCDNWPIDYDLLITHWFDQDWQEVIVLFSAYLLRVSTDNILEFINTISEYLLSLDLKLCIKGASLLGIIFKEIYPNITFLENSQPWKRLKERLKIVFFEEVQEVSVQDRCNAAIAYGLSGDERIKNFENTFVTISKGHFYIGAQHQRHCGRKFDIKATSYEYPVKEISMNEFEIRKYPITVEEYEAFVNCNGYQMSEAIWTLDGLKWRTKNDIHHPRNWKRQIHLRNSPVTGISWYEAVAYCNWLTISSNGEYLFSLPSESEWEYAYVKSYDNSVENQRFNCYTDFEIQTKTPVGIFPISTSKNGLTDMLGNVEEWCLDSWHPSLLNCPSDGTAFCNLDEIGAVTRGGSTIRTKRLCRFTYRARCNKDTKYDTIGFRIVRRRHK